MPSVKVNENASYTLPNCSFTPTTNYVFESWQVNGVKKAVGESITVTADTTIKAIWKLQILETLADLIAQGKITQGTVIKYTPTVKSLKLGNDETGATNSEQTTDTTAEWRVLYTDGGNALITTYAPVNSVKLSSEVGYENGVAALTKLCKTLYSGQGLTAKSLTIEDIEKATGIDTDSEIQAKYLPYKAKYAYYPKGTDLTQVTPPSGYTAVEHTASYSNGFTEPRFYERDSGGVLSGDYWTPTETNPVCISRTYYTYNPGLTGVMNTSYSWLASPCAYTGGSDTFFFLRGVNGSDIGAYDLCVSTGVVRTQSDGVRPAVYLDDSVLVDTANGEFAIYESEKEKHTITFDANGGSGSMASVEVNENASYTLPSCGFTPQENYIFESWQVNGATKAVGESITVTADTTIKAIWKLETLETLADLIAQGKITQGTVIKYTPTSKSLKLENDETGATNSEQTTVTTAEWRVLYTDGGNALITTYDPVNLVELSGDVGYKNGVAALTKLCETLYSGQGLTARSLTIEDIEKATGIDTDAEIKEKDSRYKTKYAFYPKGTDLTKVTLPSGYIPMVCPDSLVEGLTEPRFYERDSGGIQSGDYWTPTENNPVCITNTEYYFDPELTNVISYESGWLASKCVYIDNVYADFDMRYVGAGCIGAIYLCNSNGYMISPEFEVRPAVSLDSSVLIDTANGEFAIYEK